MESPNMQSHSMRRHDVDWIRNLALILLIFYHVGMYYVLDWGWHIKSDQQSRLLQEFMILSNQWRMSLLFFISGVTLALVQPKFSSVQLAALRVKRLFIPLVFGMLVIVPPQLYYELSWAGHYSGSYWQFLLQYLDLDTELAPHKQSSIGLLTWNHLWYLAYLFVYSLIFLTFFPLLKRMGNSRMIQAISPWGWAALVTVMLMVIWLNLRRDFPVTHGLTDDWYNHAKSFSVMMMGYLLVYRQDVWQRIIQYRYALLLTGICTYSFIVADRNGAFEDMGQLFTDNLWVRVVYGMILSINLWSWLLAVVGLAGHFLTRSNGILRYANQAVLPWYILHQSLIIIFAVQLAQFDLPTWLESILLIAMTCAGCALGFEVIRRFYLLRLLFGINNNNHTNRCGSSKGEYTECQTTT